MTTASMPYRLQLKAGHFFTEFGRLNPRHPHQWHWQDQPVVNTRFFGPDGMRGPGVRLEWLMPLPWYSELVVGAQNANGETMASFLAGEEFFTERPVGNRPFVDRGVKTLKDLAYLARLESSRDLSGELTAKLGLSGLYGPNATGPKGETLIYGADLVVKWRPERTRRGWPFVLWETEIMKRRYRADAFFDDSDPANVTDLPAATLRDWGAYTQLLYGSIRGGPREFVTTTRRRSARAWEEPGPTRSGTTGAGFRRLSPGIPPSSPVFASSTTTTGPTTCPGRTPTPYGWEPRSCTARIPRTRSRRFSWPKESFCP